MSDKLNKWRDGLAKTSKATFGQIASLLGASEISDETYEELEALLIKADLGIETSESLLEVLWERERQEGMTKTTELTGVLRNELIQRLDSPPHTEFLIEAFHSSDRRSQWFWENHYNCETWKTLSRTGNASDIWCSRYIPCSCC